MAIEVTSIPGPTRLPSISFLTETFVFFAAGDPRDKRNLWLRFLCGVLAIAFIISSDSLLRSYKHYSRLIDARLASGYFTSHSGLYAAPRVLIPGQKITREGLIASLRRAGYVKSDGSTIWSGSFKDDGDRIEIRPTANQSRSSLVEITFSGDRLLRITEDSVAINSFTLEPELLSNDGLMKSGKRETIRFAEIPSDLVHAILATEDRRFFDHSGVDVFGMARAFWRNAGDERIGQGGSTITQQLVKNTYLSPERTLRRKYAEAMLSLALEQRLTKQDIFALYCNEIYLGQRDAVAVRGVDEAAHIYFGHDLKDLSLAEAATIAGMIQGPMRFSPVYHEDAARARRNIVLAAMARDGWISTQQLGVISNEPVRLANFTTAGNSMAPYFVDYVTRLSEAEEDRRVFTTVDLDLQRLAEKAIQQQLNRISETKPSGPRPQAALVALDPKTGNILAMVGGSNYAESQLNRATDARRQPGSTFKPFVYAAAIEDGMSPVQTFSDTPREFTYDHDKIYRPANYGGGYSMSDVTMRTGLVKSLNVVTVDVALQTGLARIANLAQSFGMPRPERYPSLALGTKEVTPLELAAAYAAFVNGGHRVAPRAILSVGEPPATHDLVDQNSQPQVVSATTAYMITNMLSAVIDHGTARSARNAITGTAIAGKTGTSRDGWFVGYSPNLVCAVWIGFDDNQQLGLTGADAALPAWTDFMKNAVDLRPELGGRNFDCPEGIEFVEIDADNGSLATLSCPRRELIAVTEKLAPHVECLLHGNLPESVGDSSEVAESDSPPSVKAQHAAATYSPAFISSIRSTRIDVNRQGKQTLVNDMR